ALLWRSPTSEQLSASLVLLVSGLGYSLAYIIVGIATDFRYHYWSVIAIQTSLIVAFPLLMPRVRNLDRALVACIFLLLLTVAAGFFARLTDNQSLVF